MNIQINAGKFLLGLLLVTELYAVVPVIREASFHKVFDNRDFYGAGKDMQLRLSVMSGDGKVVAFYGSDNHGMYNLFIHNFESTASPVEVTLPSYVGAINWNAGLVSNYDGTRIFFNARDTSGDYHHHLFGMVNGKTGAVTILLQTSTVNPSYVDVPQDMGTDAAGDYLYFNESDNGYGRGNLYRIAAHIGAVPQLIINAELIPSPYGGTVYFIDNFDVSDDGNSIAFFGLGNVKTDGTGSRYGREVFVKTTSGIKNLTSTTESKGDMVISGNGSTIIYTENYKWMVASPSDSLNGQRQIETDYRSCGDRPGITKDGSTILGRSTFHGTSSCNAYLIQTDGSSRLMIEPPHISIGSTSDGLHLSDDGKRTFFKNRWYVYPDEWYNMTAGTFGGNLWATEVPSVTGASYPGDMYTKLENDEHPEVRITVNDPQNLITEEKQVKVYNLLPDGYQYPNSSPASQTAPVYVGIWGYTDNTTNTFYRNIYKGPAWPARTPIMTARFSVVDDDYNVGYMDTPLTCMLTQGTTQCMDATVIPIPGIWLPNCDSDRLMQGTNTCAYATPAIPPGFILPTCQEGERLVQGTSDCN